MTRSELRAVLAFIERTRAPAVDCLGVAVADPIWSMVLFLLRRHLANQLVTVSALAAASGVPYATAMRRIGELFAAGLICRRPRGPTGRSFAVEPTPELLQRVERFATIVKARVGETLGLTDDAPATYYFGGSYLAARIIPAPARADLGVGSRPMRLLLKRQPSFNAMVRLRGTLEQLANCRIELTLLELEELLGRLLANARASTSDFDIVAVNFGWLGELVAAGALIPLDERLTPPPAGLFDFYPGAWEAGQLGRHQYGIPIEPNAELLCYRRDLFEAAGIAPPRTLQAMLDAGRRLHRPLDELWGIAWNAAPGQPLGQTFVQVLSGFGEPPLHLQRRGQHIDLGDLAGEALRPALDTSAARACADFLLALREISPPDFASVEWDRRLAIYASGHAAMAYNWSSRIAEFELDPTAAARGRTGYLPHPSARDGWAGSPVGGYALAIPANLERSRQDLAWRVIQWLTSPSLSKLLAVNGASVSPRFSVAADPEVLAISPVIGVVDGLARAGQLHRWSHPPVAEFSRMIQIIGEELHPMLVGLRSPRAALAAAQARVDELMRAAGHY